MSDLTPDDAAIDAFLKVKGAKAVTYRGLMRILRDVLKGLGQALTAKEERIIAIEARLLQLESRPPSPKYLGVFKDDVSYKRGDMTTRRGALWLATIDTTDIPGHSSTWKMVTKSGGAEP